MKKKYVAVLLGMALCGTSMNTYSVDIKAESEENQEAEIEATEIEETEGTDAAEEEAQEKTYGEVVSVSEESVTVKTGTMAKREPGENGEEKPEESQEPEEYAAVMEYTEDTQTEGESYLSSGTDENAVHVLEDAKVVMKDAQIERSSEESTGGDTSSFYGVGAALLASGGEAYVSNSTVTTDAAGGGTLYAWDLNVETKGESSAAIRSDRGGGTMVINGGRYTSKGTGSPAVYCTADISANNAELTAEGSEAVCIEGLNSLHLYDSDLSGNMSDDSRNDCTWNVILYQSMSGDSEVGNRTFEMNGGTLTGKNGGMFYTTNTESTITLSDVDITYPEECDYFLKCTGNDNERGWGTSGANGADCLFTAVSQDMTGDILWDSISRLDLYLTQGSTLEGAMVMDETCAGTGGEGTAKIFISEDSQWTVTGDSTAGELYCAGTIADTEGKTVTIKGTDGTVYEEGDGEYTITVDYYEDTTDLSGASQTTQWSSAEVEKPTEL